MSGQIYQLEENLSQAWHLIQGLFAWSIVLLGAIHCSDVRSGACTCHCPGLL